MQQFEITLKNEKLRLYNQLSWIIIFILTLVFAYLTFFSGDDPIKGRKVVFIIAMAAALMLKVYFEKTKYRFGVYVFFYFLMTEFVVNGYYLLAGISLFFQVFHLISTRKKIAVFSKEKIRYPSFPTRYIHWNSLNNCMLKDGWLTIDSKDNKIIQQLIDEEKTKINEKEFNEFCRDQLRKSGPWKDEPGVWDALGYGLPDIPI